VGGGAVGRGVARRAPPHHLGAGAAEILGFAGRLRRPSTNRSTKTELHALIGRSEWLPALI
jgi:hypothetical protein